MEYKGKNIISIMIIIVFTGAMLLSMQEKVAVKGSQLFYHSLKIKKDEGELLLQEMRQRVSEKIMQTAEKIKVEQGIVETKEQMEKEMVVSKTCIDLPDMEWALFRRQKFRMDQVEIITTDMPFMETLQKHERREKKSFFLFIKEYQELYLSFLPVQTGKIKVKNMRIK